MHHPILTRPRRAGLALLAGAALTCGAGAASADAATYCVAKPDCPGGTPVLGLDAALKLAATSIYTSDTIELGPATFATDTGFHYYAGNQHPANDVRIHGSPGTVLAAKSGTASGAMTVLSVEGAGAADSVVSGLEVRVPVGSAPFATGLMLREAAAEDVAVTAMPGLGSSVAAGIDLRQGADLRSSSVDLAPVADGAALALRGSPHTVEDVKLSGGGTALSATGDTAAAKISRARIDARGPSDYGINCKGCELELDDSLIQVDGTDRGILAAPDGAITAGVHASHVTIAGLSPATAVHAGTTQAGAAKVWLDNCILATWGTALRAVSLGSGAVTITARNCNYDEGQTVTEGTGTVDAQAITHFTTGFAGSWNADYRLHWSSPLIDAARTAGLYVPSPFTVDGLARSVDGNVDGAAVPDLGAFEYQAKPPVAKLLGPSVAKAGVPVTFDGSKSYDGDPNEPVRYEWALPGGAKATSPSVTVALPAGKQVIALTVVDPKGKTSSASRTVDVAPAPVVGAAPPPVAQSAAPLLSELRVDPRAIRSGRRAHVRFELAHAAAVRAQLRRRADGRWRRVTTVRADLAAGAQALRLPRLQRSGRYRVRVEATAADGATAGATKTFRVRAG